MKRKNWTKEEELFLIENYSNKSNDELSKILNRTSSSITKKSNVLNLKKSKEHKNKIIL